jgi:hypothetical protein
VKTAAADPRVARGAAWLDFTGPGWWQAGQPWPAHVGWLTRQRGELRIAGYAARYLAYASEVIPDGNLVVPGWSLSHGFLCSGTRDDWAAMTEAWRQAISRRRRAPAGEPARPAPWGGLDPGLAADVASLVAEAPAGPAVAA